MVVSPLLRPLGLAAAFVGACQGLVWTILTLLSILIGTDAWTPEFKIDQVFEPLLVAIFFKPETLASNAGEDLVMTGDVFLGFSFFYFIMSFVWMATSLTMFWVLFREKWEYGANTIKAWCVITGIISLFDLTIVIILGVDFHHLKTTYAGPLSFPFEVVVGSVMTIVARGYVLWVDNVVCTIFFFKWASEISKYDYGKDDLNRRSYIDGFDDPWRTSNEASRFPRSHPIDNPVYQHDERTSFPRSISQEPPQHQPRRFVPPSEHQQHQQLPPQRPQKPRAPTVPQQQPQQQQGPYIPHPDYPNYAPNDLERMPRSALKTRSYYN